MSWTKGKEEQLIALMLERPVLWDKSNAQHKNSYLLAKKWDEVAKELSVAKVQAKNKWKALTLAYKKEVGRLPILRSGAGGSEANISSDWPHFQAMQFLYPRRTKQGQSNLGGLSSSDEDEPTTMAEGINIKTVQVRPKIALVSNMTLHPEDKAEEIADWHFLLSLLPDIKLIKCQETKLRFKIESTMLVDEFLRNSKIKKSQEEIVNDDDCQVVDCKMGKGERY